MDTHSAHFMAGLQIAILVIALVLTLNSLRVAWESYSRQSKSIQKSESHKTHFDDDGDATPQSQSQFAVRWPNFALALAALAGIAIALTEAIVSTLNVNNFAISPWLDVLFWGLIILQSALVIREHQNVSRFHLAMTASASYSLVPLPLLVRVYLFVNDEGNLPTDVQAALQCTKLALGFAGFAACFAFPRRPAVFDNGKPVDGQFTISGWARYTFSWATPVLEQSRHKKLDHDDLPFLHSDARSSVLYQRFQKLKERSLTKNAIISIWPGLWRQQFFTVLDAFFNMAPPFALFQLLRVLELRDAGHSVGKLGAFWVVGMGILQFAGGYINARTWWYSEAAIHVPLRIELGALVFAKSMRKKDVKGATKSDHKDQVKSDASSTDNGKPQDVESGSSTAVEDDIDDRSEAMKQTRQGVVNLVGVDANRLANFAMINNFLTGAVIKLVVSFYFLNSLVGWIPMLAGIAANLMFLPVNIYFSKKYVRHQDRVMKARDKKLAIVNEALTGIRQIKFAALENRWQAKILESRELELTELWGAMKSDVALIAIWITGPMFLSTATLATYAYIQGRLEPSTAFTTISILGKIEVTLSYLPELTTNFMDAIVSINRIAEYLRAPEQEEVTQHGDRISFQKATIAWPADELADDAFKLHDLVLDFPIGELSVVSGRTGSGKSLLLSSILGECELLSGTITMPSAPTVEERKDKDANKSNWILPGAVAYVPQIPWIENATFRDNILFGLPFDEERYNQVIFACSLELDLKILADGDKTEIGPKGINLSGGQCWRLTLARALYSRAGILVLDDIFSAVDAHVGKHIYENALTGPICEGRTRILVTHHVALCLPRTNYEVQLGEGGVKHAGLVKELQRTGALEAVLANESAVDDQQNAVEETLDTSEVQRRLSEVSRRLSHQSSKGSALKKTTSHRRASENAPEPIAESPSKPPEETKAFVKNEETQTGRVELRMYIEYLKACGGVPFWLGVVFLFAIYEVFILLKNWILREWTGEAEVQGARFHTDYRVAFQNYLHPSKTDLEPGAGLHTLSYWLTLYLGITVVMCLEGTVRYLVVFTGSIKASRKMFQRLTYAVLRAPLRWLDTMPTGRVLNRFTADFNTFDMNLAYGFAFFFWNLLAVVGIIIAGAMVSPFIIIASTVLLVLCTYYALYYLSGARETKRLESTAKSPIFEHFNAALQGVGSIRAYAKSSDYLNRMFFRLDRHARCLYHLALFKRWLSLRFQLIGTVYVIIVASILMGIKTMDAGLGGFALTFALMYNEHIYWLLRHYTEAELGMNSTERIVEYSEIEIEKQGGDEVPASWPSAGGMEVENLVVAYAPDLDPVLNGLNFQVKPKERIGVVGRTGAGKSSLTLAIFRFLEAREGQVLVDGVDISKIKLETLRSRLAIIPQDPVLFSGTVRSNLDPFDERSDLELRDALRRVHLTTEMSTPPENMALVQSKQNVNMFDSLHSAISEGGQNLSQGQRQLLCLARAIVARPKIMVLDEATSAVDKTTDGLIQRSIREEFGESTLLVIAHRLSTIADFDRILVLDAGKVVEFDTPKNLVCKTDGVFRGMVESSGESEALMETMQKE